jgi:hypothetical protein
VSVGYMTESIPTNQRPIECYNGEKLLDSSLSLTGTGM